MRITEPLDPGETLEIDGENLQIKLGNQDAYDYVAGELFDLSGGSNTIVCTDDESGRSVEIEIRFEPRYL